MDELPPLDDRSSRGGLESDGRIVSQSSFNHDTHDFVEGVVCLRPLASFTFAANDTYPGSPRSEMDALFCVFVLKECNGWDAKRDGERNNLDTCFNWWK